MAVAAEDGGRTMTSTKLQAIPEPIDDPKEMWHLQKPERIEREGAAPEWRVGIELKSAWDLVKSRGEGIRVVIFDTGVDWEHPSLQLNVDMKSARDFDHGIGRGLTPDEGGLIANKFDAHGTASAGIIGAIDPGDPRLAKKGIMLPADCKVVGIAPCCTLVPVRLSTTYDVKILVEALKYAGKVGDVILLPRSLECSSQLTDVLEEVGSRCVIVCAAGNDGSDALIYPASLEATIAVGACNEKGYRSSYSQYGPGLHVVAPSNDQPAEDRERLRLSPAAIERRLAERGDPNALPLGSAHFGSEQRRTILEHLTRGSDWHFERLGRRSIATTDNLGPFGYNYQPVGNYCRADGDFGFGGTSAAAAQVAGVVALMLAANPSLINEPGAVKKLLTHSTCIECLHPEDEGRALPRAVVDADRSSHWEEPDLEFGFGLINARKAVERAAGGKGRYSTR